MIIAASVVMLVVGAELLIKRHIREIPQSEKPFKLTSGIEITESKNYGLIFGAFKNKTRLVKILHGLGMAVCAFLLVRPLMKSSSAVFKIGAGLFIGGGLSNLLDRLLHGCVTDYFRFCKAKWKKFNSIVFNLGDICLALGAILLVISSEKNKF